MACRSWRRAAYTNCETFEAGRNNLRLGVKKMSIHFYGWFYLNTHSYDDKVEIARKINLITAQHGYGIQMGLWNLPEDICLDLLISIDKDTKFIELKDRNLLSFNLLSNPLDSCAHLIFDTELSINNRLPFDETNFIKYLHAIWNIQEIISSLIFVTWDPGADFNSFPFYQISFKDFLQRIYNYYIILPDENYGKDGVYEIKKIETIEDLPWSRWFLNNLQK
jgi:hypothetical protein